MKTETAPQLHAGDSTHFGGGRRKVWHTDFDGLYWTGDHYPRTAAELLKECETTIADLLRNHPELERHEK